MAEEVGSAFVSLIPSARGFSRIARREVRAALAGVSGEVRLIPVLDQRQAAAAGRRAARVAQAAAGTVDLRVGLDRRSLSRVISSLAGFGRVATLATGGLAAIGALGAGASAGLAGLASAAAGLIPILGQLVGVLITAAGAAAALPGAFAIAAAGIGALIIGSSGLGAALKEAGKQATGGGAAATNFGRQTERAARQVVLARRGIAEAARRVTLTERGLADAARGVTLAERSLADAQRASRRAQEDLNRAREEAREDLEDLSLSLARARLDEEAAIFGVEDALRELNAAHAAQETTPDDIARLDLAYRESVQTLAEVRERLGDVTEEQAAAAAAGVEGADGVRSALQEQRDAAVAVADAQHDVAQANLAVADAQHELRAAHLAVADAQFNLTQAQQDLTDAQAKGAASSGAAAAAMAALAPAAQELVRTLLALKPAWDALRLDVQQTLWAGVAAEVRNLADAQLPVLREGLVGVAGVLNGAMKTGLRTLATESSQLRLGQIFDSAASALDKLAVAVEPLLVALLDLSAVGAEVVDQLAGPAGKALAQFGERISQMAQTGELKRLILDGLDALKLLGGALLDIGGIFKGIFAAAGEAGGGGIFGFLDRLNETVNSIAGQEALTRFFSELGRIGDALMPVLLALGRGIGVVARAIGDIAVETAPFLELFIGDLARALSLLAPAFIALGPAVAALGNVLEPVARILSGLVVGAAPGIEVFLLALADALTILAPTARPVGEALGALLTALAPLLPVLGQALANSLTAAATALATFATAFAPLIEEFATGALQQLAPQLPELAAAGILLANSFAEMARELMPLIPFLVDLVGLFASAPVIGLLAINGAVQQFTLGLQLLKAPADAVIGFFRFLGGVDWAGIGSAIGDAFSTAWQAVTGFFADVFTWFRALPGTVATAVGATVGTLLRKGRDLVTGLFNGVTQRYRDVRTWLRGLPGRVRDAVGSLTGTLASRGRNLLQGLRNGITERYNSVRTWLHDLPTRLRNAVGGLGSALWQAGRNLIQGLLNGISSRFQAVRDLLGRLTDLLPSWKGPEQRDRRILRGAGVAVMQGFQTGIEDQMPALESTLTAVADDVARRLSGSPVGGDAAAPAGATVLIDPTGLPRGLDQWLRGAVRIKGGGSVQFAYGVAR